jgi:hypothetical protein
MNETGPPGFIAHLSPAELAQFGTKLRRKIDCRLLPMLMVMYVLDQLDRNNIAFARIAGKGGKGLEYELKLSSTEYQTAISVFFIGYLFMQGALLRPRKEMLTNSAV